MEKEVKDVVTEEATSAENASTQNEQATESKETKVTETAPAQDDNQVNKVAEESVLALEKAEKRIVDLKRQLKDAGVDPNGNEEFDDEEKIERIAAKVAQKLAPKTEDESESSRLRKQLSEAKLALAAKNSLGNSGVGSNQSKLGREPNLPSLTLAEKQLAQRIAQRKGVSVKEAERQLAESKAKSGEELGVI